MEAMAVQTALADSKIQQLNQAIDQYIGLLTGGTGGMAAFTTSLSNIGQVAGTTAGNLGTATVSMSLNARQFGAALSKGGTLAASAWTNFDQVIGSTMPSLMDWFRQAATLGATTGPAVSKAALDMAAAMAKYAGSNKTAQATVLGFLRAQGLNFPTWDKMLAAMKKQGAGQKDLAKQVDGTTLAMSHLSKMAQNTAAVLNTQVTSSLAAAALKASGYNTDLANMVIAQQKGTASGHNAAYWAQQAGIAYQNAGRLATTWGNDVSSGAHRADSGAAGHCTASSSRSSSCWRRSQSHPWTINVDIAQHGGITLPGMPIGTRITAVARRASTARAAASRSSASRDPS